MGEAATRSFETEEEMLFTKLDMSNQRIQNLEAVANQRISPKNLSQQGSSPRPPRLRPGDLEDQDVVLARKDSWRAPPAVGIAEMRSRRSTARQMLASRRSTINAEAIGQVIKLKPPDATGPLTEPTAVRIGTDESEEALEEALSRPRTPDAPAATPRRSSVMQEVWQDIMTLFAPGDEPPSDQVNDEPGLHQDPPRFDLRPDSCKSTAVPSGK